MLQKATDCATYVWKQTSVGPWGVAKGEMCIRIKRAAGCTLNDNFPQVFCRDRFLPSTYDVVGERILDVSLFNDVSVHAVIWAIKQAPERDKC